MKNINFTKANQNIWKTGCYALGVYQYLTSLRNMTLECMYGKCVCVFVYVREFM